MLQYTHAVPDDDGGVRGYGSQQGEGDDKSHPEKVLIERITHDWKHKHDKVTA